MATSFALRVICVMLLPVLALMGSVSISSCECGCLEVSPLAACCCHATGSGSEAAAVAEGGDDCRTEMGQQKPPADVPSAFRLNPEVTAIAAVGLTVPQFVLAVPSTEGAQRPYQLAPAASPAPRAPPLV